MDLKGTEPARHGQSMRSVGSRQTGLPLHLGVAIEDALTLLELIRCLEVGDHHLLLAQEVLQLVGRRFVLPPIVGGQVLTGTPEHLDDHHTAAVLAEAQLIPCQLHNLLANGVGDQLFDWGHLQRLCFLALLPA